MIEDKEIEQLFNALRNYDSNMMIIEEFKNEVQRRQPNFMVPENE